MTEAIAHSNNYYFANLGVKLGYERVNYYAHLFGYGEKAGPEYRRRAPRTLSRRPPKNGGVGMLTSFGEEISQTPLQLAALMGAVANGGTLYWLQYPKTQAEAKNFQPQVKRHLDIKNVIEEVKPGMQGAVEFGTARRAKQDDVILGKTGTCSEGRTHLGWFGSFNESGQRKLVVVVMLTGGRPSIGPMASGVAGDVYQTPSRAELLQDSTHSHARGIDADQHVHVHTDLLIRSRRRVGYAETTGCPPRRGLHSSRTLSTRSMASH